ncbi:MAG: PHP domain-containing protein [Gemmatimonadales bacterium]
MRLVRRHLVAVALGLAVLAAALAPLPAVMDTVTGAPAGDAYLARSLAYVLLAPFSSTLDALTFLSIDRAIALLVTWIPVLALAGALRPGTPRRRLARALTGVALFLAFATAAVLLPRPVPRLVADEPGVTVLDIHAHTVASHDGRPGWTPERLAAWHAAQGFQAAYVTDHNVPFAGSTTTPIRLLPGVEWSVYRQHIVALGASDSIDRRPYSSDLPGLLGLFGALHAQGAMAIASLPEYWRNHRHELDEFALAGVDGFEIVNCAPKGLALPSSARREVIDLARRHDLLVFGASDNHGWGMVTCVWNLSHQGAHGFRANYVIARPVALLQGDIPAWTAAYSQPWLMFRSLSWPERISWLTWIALGAIWRGMPRRKGQRAGLGILARTLGRRPRGTSQ